MERLLILRNNAAIDATILTKDKAVPIIANYFNVPLKKTATIGDEVLDIPMLTYSGLGFVGSPSNSQQSVLETVRHMKNGYVSKFSVFRGFYDFYSHAKKRGIELVISDRDGVIKSEREDKESEKEFHRLCLEMGTNGPYIAILTGSGIGQNKPFAKSYGLDQRLKENPKVVKRPFLLYIESGAIHYNVISGEIKNFISELDPELVKILKGDFEENVIRRIESEVFPLFNLTWANDCENKTMMVYHPEKLSMVTIDLPRFYSDGESFRKSHEGDLFRDNVVEIMKQEATSLGIPFFVRE
jgi:hypothetical protein